MEETTDTKGRWLRWWTLAVALVALVLGATALVVALGGRDDAPATDPVAVMQTMHDSMTGSMGGPMGGHLANHRCGDGPMAGPMMGG